MSDLSPSGLMPGDEAPDVARGPLIEGQLWNFSGTADAFDAYCARLVAAPHLSGPLPYPIVEILKVFNERGRRHERVLVLCCDPLSSLSSTRPVESGRVFSLSRFDFDPGGPWELVWGPKIRKLRPKYFVDDVDDVGGIDDVGGVDGVDGVDGGVVVELRPNPYLTGFGDELEVESNLAGPVLVWGDNE